MITRVKGSVWNAQDNFGAVSVADLGRQNTDITAALTTAMLAGNTIFIPIGTWLISSITVPADCTIFGLGEKSILKQKDTSNAVAVNVGSGASLRDFTVDSNKVNQVGANLHSFQFNSAVNTNCSGLYSLNAKGSGFRITGAGTNEVTLIGCESTGHTESGFLVDTGINVFLGSCRAFQSDAIATGDGIAIASNGGAVTNVTLDSPVVKNQSGRGISIIGNGSKNVTNVLVNNARVSNNISHGMHLVNADSVSVSGANLNTNAADGLRVEGDVQNCRFFGVLAKGNTSFGIREIIAGSTPNFNGFIYGLAAGNGNNTITKVGASSYIV